MGPAAAASVLTSTDVLIVGGGIAGLSAARRLVAAGASVTLLEANARVGGASLLMGAWRVTFWGALAMAMTAAVGAAFGVAMD